MSDADIRSVLKKCGNKDDKIQQCIASLWEDGATHQQEDEWADAKVGGPGWGVARWAGEQSARRAGWVCLVRWLRSGRAVRRRRSRSGLEGRTAAMTERRTSRPLSAESGS